MELRTNGLGRLIYDRLQTHNFCGVHPGALSDVEVDVETRADFRVASLMVVFLIAAEQQQVVWNGIAFAWWWGSRVE